MLPCRFGEFWRKRNSKSPKPNGRVRSLIVRAYSNVTEGTAGALLLDTSWSGVVCVLAAVCFGGTFFSLLLKVSGRNKLEYAFLDYSVAVRPCSSKRLLCV